MCNSVDLQANNWLTEFFQCIRLNKFDCVANLFLDNACWRDLLAFSWNIITVAGRNDIFEMLNGTCPRIGVIEWKITGEVIEESNETSCWFNFSTPIAKCKGKLSLIDGKCSVLFTSIDELIGHEEAVLSRREIGYVNAAVKDRKTWLDIKSEREQRLGDIEQPYVVIVGGGQGGIGLSARLGMLGVTNIVLDRNKNAGDSWRNRYRSLYLRNTVWQDHMPYLEFPDSWPIFMSKDRMADWLEMYVKVMEINYWVSSVCVGAKYLTDREEWIVKVKRNGKIVQLRPKHLVIATGMSGNPKVPDIEGLKLFRGVICHSSKYKTALGFAGKDCIVIGSNSSAHDICMDLWEHGANVTMVQRSETLVVRSETFFERSQYTQTAADSGIKTAELDIVGAAVPYQVMRRQMISSWMQIAKKDHEYYRRLVEAGFKLTFGQDQSGLEMMYMYRGSGYYIDVGATELIVSGAVKLRSGVSIKCIVDDGVILSDNSELKADLIVFATGYQPMSSLVSKLISPEVAAKVGECWGLGSGTKYDPGPWQGELRNMWKPTAQNGLWFHGGGLTQSRLYSRFLAMQLKARMENIPTPVYGVPNMHHLQ
ncbi:MAG: FAD-dependent oxidoreductase [Chloroflexi bacterium]|nr:FAD-dependent oxidoreductase [Chloroflexota bacterium]